VERQPLVHQLTTRPHTGNHRGWGTLTFGAWGTLSRGNWGTGRPQPNHPQPSQPMMNRPSEPNRPPQPNTPAMNRPSELNRPAGPPEHDDRPAVLQPIDHTVSSTPMKETQSSRQQQNPPAPTAVRPPQPQQRPKPAYKPQGGMTKSIRTTSSRGRER